MTTFTSADDCPPAADISSCTCKVAYGEILMDCTDKALDVSAMSDILQQSRPLLSFLFSSVEKTLFTASSVKQKTTFIIQEFLFRFLCLFALQRLFSSVSSRAQLWNVK